MGLPFALLVGFAVSLLEIDRRELRLVLTLGLVLLLAFAWSPYRFAAVDRARDEALSASIRETADYLRTTSAPDDRVFVLGGEPVVYFLADRRAPTRFFVWMHHWDRFREALASLGVGPAELMPELPRFMVRGPQPERVPELEELLATRYRVRARFGGYTVAELVSPGLYQGSAPGDS